jgi:hypothetical protein
VSDNVSAKLPTTTKELAQYLRDLATQIDRIPSQSIVVGEDDVEVGFFYGNPMFPQMPTGVNLQIDICSYPYRPAKESP